MVTIPAEGWRGGAVRQALTIGLVVGASLGALAWIDAESWMAGVAVFLIVGTGYGIFMQRRMARYWPGAKDLAQLDRVAVVRTVRSGGQIANPRLAQPMIDYATGLRAAADHAKPFRWVIPLVLLVGVGTTVFDALEGTWGNLIASAIYLVALLVEVFWWPVRQRQLVEHADRSAKLANSILELD